MNKQRIKSIRKKRKIIKGGHPLLKDYAQYLKEWISIESVVLNEYDHPYIIPSENDECELKKNVECSDPCITYKEKCINKVRKQKFRDNEIIIYGKDGKSFKTLSSGKLNYTEPEIQHYDYDELKKAYPDSNPKPRLAKRDVDIYYHELQELTSNNRYVLFPVGMVLKELFTNNIAMKWLEDLADKIYERETNEKYCICGHSMGCVLSLYLGLIIFFKYPVFFEKTIVVIGSAPYRWLDATIEYKGWDLKTFKDLPNVLTFIYCRVNKDKFLADTFYSAVYSMQREFDNNNKYEPMFILYDDISEPYSISLEKLEKDKSLYDTDKIKGKEEDWSKEESNRIHSWGNYYQAFKRLLEIEGGKKRKTIRLRIAKTYRNKQFKLRIT